MIHVKKQPEPASFDQAVRQKGLNYLATKGINPSQPLPSVTTLHAYWRKCSDELYTSYNEQCAYLAMYFERATGYETIDHYIAKSKRPDLAYEWNNYRLSSPRMNSRKRDYDDILDPFKVKNGWFRLEFGTFTVYPSPELDSSLQCKIQKTIDRLNLNDPLFCRTRKYHYDDFIKKEYTQSYFRKKSPFVWFEAKRQGLI